MRKTTVSNIYSNTRNISEPKSKDMSVEMINLRENNSVAALKRKSLNPY